jgi:hypothetical protein
MPCYGERTWSVTTIWIIAGSFGSLFLAALFTVLLVTTSRRATLQQINLSLMQLAEQVR